MRNLLAPSWPAGTAICRCEALDQTQPISHWASTGLFNHNIPDMFCKRAEWKQLISRVRFTGPFTIRLYHTDHSCSRSKSLCRGSPLFTEEGSWSLPACSTWLHPCNSRGEKQEWRGSSVTHILFLTHNLLQNHTSLCCSHTMRCMLVSVYVHMSLCVTCLNTSKHRCAGAQVIHHKKEDHFILFLRIFLLRKLQGIRTQFLCSFLLLWYSGVALFTYHLQVILFCKQCTMLFILSDVRKGWHLTYKEDIAPLGRHVHESTRPDQLWHGFSS